MSSTGGRCVLTDSMTGLVSSCDVNKLLMFLTDVLRWSFHSELTLCVRSDLSAPCCGCPAPCCGARWRRSRRPGRCPSSAAPPGWADLSPYAPPLGCRPRTGHTHSYYHVFSCFSETIRCLYKSYLPVSGREVLQRPGGALQRGGVGALGQQVEVRLHHHWVPQQLRPSQRLRETRDRPDAVPLHQTPNSLKHLTKQSKVFYF